MDSDSGDEASARSEQSAARFPLVLACFFLSGFAALIYQTAWTRQFAFVFGTSELAVATVLAAYMGGLALGAALAARYAPRVARPILVYGLIELGIAIAALAVPFGIRISQSLYLAAFGAAGEPPGEGGLISALFYLLCSFVILLPATALMGATLPLLARYAVKSESQIGSRIGALYTANTVGALVGTATAGFALLPTLGLAGTVWTAVGGNALVFLAAALLARGTAPAPPTSATTAAQGGRNSWILPLIALSGSASFLYEVLWTRMLGQILGGSVYAFATMLSTFLAGIALGSWAASRMASTREKSVRGFAWAQIGTAALALAAFKFADRLPEIARELAVNDLLGDAAICAMVLLPSTIFIGATFPFAVRIHARDEHDASAASARVYSWNTVGSIVGAIGAGFFLLPAVGYAISMASAVALNLLLAIAVLCLLRPMQRTAFAVATCALVLLFIVPPSSPAKLLASSPFTRMSATGDLMFFKVGRSSTVQLRNTGGAYSLLTNGLQEAIIEPEGAAYSYSPLAAWMAGLPVLARPDAKSMLVVGLGGGGVVEAAPASLERIDVVELEPEVVEANRHLSSLRVNDPLADPRVHITVNDARGSLLLTRRHYDSIVSQPSHPWTAGASHLYTREFFQLARDRLNDGGILLQWMGLGFVDDSLLQILVASLLDVFEHVNLYAPIHGGVLLMASPQPMNMQAGAAEALRRSPLGFATMGVFRVEDVAAGLILDDAGARAFAAGAPVNTDDYNMLQTRSPAIARKRKVGVSVDALIPKQDPLLQAASEGDAIQIVRSLIGRNFIPRATRVAASIEDPALKSLANAMVRAARPGSRSRFEKALALNPQSDQARFGLVLARRRDLGRPDSQLDALIASIEHGPTRAVATALRQLAQTARGSGEDSGLRALETRLAECEPGEACFLSALRLRLQWRLASGDAQDAQDALELADRFGWYLKGPDDVLLRARVAAAAGAYPGALALMKQLEVTLQRHPERAALATRAARLVRKIPDSELDTASRARLARLRAIAAGGRSGAASQRRR